MTSKKKFYDVPTKFVFKGTFRIKAESQEQAEEYVQKHCGLVIGGDIHSTLPENEVNWEFGVHPEKIVGNGNSRVRFKAKVGIRKECSHIPYQEINGPYAKYMKYNVDKEKKWCIKSILLGIENEAEKLINFEVGPTSDGGTYIEATLIIGNILNNELLKTE